VAGRQSPICLVWHLQENRLLKKWCRTIPKCLIMAVHEGHLELHRTYGPGKFMQPAVRDGSALPKLHCLALL
jgi:hypothetical protein